jgi:hypothetical protein
LWLGDVVYHKWLIRKLFDERQSIGQMFGKDQNIIGVVKAFNCFIRLKKRGAA